MPTLKCQGVEGCALPVTHIDNKGYIYCTEHGIERRCLRPCRKMTKREIATLESGGAIEWRRPSFDPALAAAFRAAKAAALEAGKNQEDGGTCNLDSPAFRIDGASAKSIERAAAEAGVSVSPFSWFGGRRWFFLRVPLEGQANLRARMSTAATQALKAASAGIPGMSVCQYCQCD